MLKGTDDQARQLIDDNFPAYQPWVDNIFSPEPSTEKTLFLVQLLTGFLLFLYCMHRLWVIRRGSRS